MDFHPHHRVGLGHAGLAPPLNSADRSARVALSLRAYRRLEFTVLDVLPSLDHNMQRVCGSCGGGIDGDFLRNRRGKTATFKPSAGKAQLAGQNCQASMAISPNKQPSVEWLVPTQTLQHRQSPFAIPYLVA